MDIGGEEIVFFVEAEGDVVAGIGGDGVEECGVVAIDDEQAVGIEGFDDAGVFAADAGEVVEEFEMLGAAVGDDGDIGLGDLGEVADFAGVVGADFED